MLRVHRAAGVESLQARDAVGRLRAGEPVPGRGAQAAWPVDRVDQESAQAGRRVGVGSSRGARKHTVHLPYRLGDTDAVAHRHGGRPRRVRRSEPVAEPVRRESQHWPALVDVLSRLEAGAQDHVLSAVAARNPDRQGDGRGGHRAGARRGGRRRGRLLAGEPRILRGLPMSAVTRPARLLDPGMCLTLRPMAYPVFFEMYRAAIKNTWTVEEVDFSTDVADLQKKMTDAERHLVHRLIAFFATGDSIVANNLVLNLYRHINAPEARMYLSRQLYEEALHVQFYLTLLDTYVPDPEDRARAFDAVESIPSIRKKAEFCLKYLDSIENVKRLETRGDR